MIRTAIAGCGNIAQVHAWALSQLQDISLVAAADIVPDKSDELLGKYADDTAKAYDNVDDMLGLEYIDVLHICTPHFLHVPMAITALKAGINVFMEKPPAITLEAFERLKEAEGRSQGKAGFCFQNRYNEATIKLDEIAASDSLGKITGARAFVTWRRDEDYYTDNWHGSMTLEGGGVLINQSIHTLDLLLRYLGTPTGICASMSNHHLQGLIEVEDTLEAWMTFEGDRRACFYASNAYVTDAPVILELTFEKGHVTLIDNILTIKEQNREPYLINYNSTPKLGKSYWGTGHLACIKDYYSHLKDGSPYQNDIAGVENIMKTTLKIYDSVNSSTPRRT